MQRVWKVNNWLNSKQLSRLRGGTKVARMVAARFGFPLQEIKRQRWKINQSPLRLLWLNSNSEEMGDLFLTHYNFEEISFRSRAIAFLVQPTRDPSVQNNCSKSIFIFGSNKQFNLKEGKITKKQTWILSNTHPPTPKQKRIIRIHILYFHCLKTLQNTLMSNI